MLNKNIIIIFVLVSFRFQCIWVWVFLGIRLPKYIVAAVLVAPAFRLVSFRLKVFNVFQSGFPSFPTKIVHIPKHPNHQALKS